VAKERIKKLCEVCCKEFEVIASRVSSARYCSYDPCFLSTRKTRQPDVTKTCEFCGCEFTVSFVRKEQRFCGKRCSNSGPNNGMFGKPGSMLGRTAWNRGLTAKTDERLAGLGAKVSESLKERFQAGASTHRGANNPNFGHTSDTLTKEQRDNYSRAAVKRVLDGVSGYKTGHVTGTHCSPKATLPVKFKSSWELVAMMHWDRSNDVLSYEYEPNVIVLSDGRRTIPDFLVRYVDGQEVIVEIKPTAIQALPEVSKKLDLTKQALAAAGAKYVVLGNVEIDAMKREIGEDFDTAVKHHQGRI